MIVALKNCDVFYPIIVNTKQTAVNKRHFSLNTSSQDLHARTKEKYTVKFARTDTLRKSAIPYLQRRLNQE